MMLLTGVPPAPHSYILLELKEAELHAQGLAVARTRSCSS